MADKNPSVINIAIVGGGTYSKEILEKTAVDYGEREVNARFRAIADPDPQSPGILLAKELGIEVIHDYHDLYDPQYEIHLIIILTPAPDVFKDILATRPPHIRILSFHVFEIFWKAIGVEESKLRDRTEEMETILNGIQDSILVITPDKEIIEVNEAFSKMMERSRDELLGRRCYDVFQEASRNQNEICDKACPLSEVVRNRRPHQLILNQTDSKGQPRHIEVTWYPIWEKDGKISKFIEISRDITVRLKEEEETTKRLEQMVEERTRQLQESHEKLLHQDKMASLGKLSASVVHEINNPVAGLLNMTMLIKRILKEESLGRKELDRFREYLDIMEAETRRTSRIVSNLLAFSRQSKMELGRVGLNRLIEQTLILNSNLLKINRIKVEKQLAPNLPELMGSADQLQQVFMNLVSNAVEAMENAGGGVLSIRTRHSVKDDKILVSLKDTGSGIPKENLLSLFEPFFTTKKGKGVGLGLSVVYGIIQDHGGSIEVKPQEDKGTTFRVELPVNPDSP